MCVTEDLVDAKPENLTFEQAAAVPLAGVTALVGLRDVGRVTAGQHVLVNGASGGVGTFAVQIAKALGADHVIDYTLDDFTNQGTRYDVVFDLVGNRTLAEFRRALSPEGTLVLSGGGMSSDGSLFGSMGLMLRGKAVSPFVRQRVVVLIAKSSREHLAALRKLIEAGSVTPAIDRTYKLSEVPDAIRYVAEEHARAKVVITV